VFTILLVGVLMSFYTINELNYGKQQQIQESIVNHPENLPESELAQITSIWFKNLKSDWYWLRAVQYIGSNAFASEYKKYLFEVLDLITDLNPYFEKPYIIGQLLIPNYNYRYEDLDKAEQEKYINQAEKLWLKGVQNFCDEEKVAAIKAETNLPSVWQEKKYKNPCKSYAPAYYLAYIYHFYKWDSLQASDYYKVAAANDDSVLWARSLAAIMQWKWGNREKSTLMFLNLAQHIETTDPYCTALATEVDTFYKDILASKNPITWQMVQALEVSRDAVLWEFSEENEEEFLWDTKCTNFLNKAIREINLAYIEQENKKFQDANNWFWARHAAALYDEWYLEFLPTDIQQYGDYWIIYQYMPETWWFDYVMWNY